MTSNHFTLGLNADSKPSSKVLRPPGGGSSDLFGADVLLTPRSGKNHMQSNIFSCEKAASKNNVRQGIHRFYCIGDQPRRGQKNIDSYNRLFGEPDRSITPAKNHMKSSIPIGGVANGKANRHHVTKNGKNGNTENGSSISSSASSITSSIENMKQNGVSKSDGNPVTGEGYKPAGAEINTTIPSLNGANQVINKNRIPPGGFSSGLW